MTPNAIRQDARQAVSEHLERFDLERGLVTVTSDLVGAKDAGQNHLVLHASRGLLRVGIEIYLLRVHRFDHFALGAQKYSVFRNIIRQQCLEEVHGSQGQAARQAWLLETVWPAPSRADDYTLSVMDYLETLGVHPELNMERALERYDRMRHGITEFVNNRRLQRLGMVPSVFTNSTNGLLGRVVLDGDRLKGVLDH